MIFLLIASYLIGSISFAWLIAKVHGLDLRKIGSGNLGATNLSRACGRKWAYTCFALDVLKGFAPVFAAKLFVIPQNPTPAFLGLWLAIGVVAILGHVFPIYLKFKGGKGVATSFGVVLGIWPYLAIPGIIAFAIWGLIVLIWKYISLASVLAAGLFPIILIIFIAIIKDWYFKNLWPLVLVASVLCSLVIVLHRTNIKRILNGTEHKVLQKES
jgi:glycerol-3-phosphate acyltransferase PlsY